MDGLTRSSLVLPLIFGCLAAGTNVRAEGMLDEVRHEVRESSSGSFREQDDDDDDDHHGHHHHYEDDCDRNFFGELLGPPLLFTITSPWWLPHAALEDDLSIWADFAGAPYADGHDGLLWIESTAPDGGKPWGARLSVEYGHDFNDLSRIGTRLMVDTSSRVGFDTEWNQWIEQTPGGHDSLSSGDFNVVIRFAQHERIQFHSGLGFNWLADSRASDFGFNFTYGVDLFPLDPWIVSSTIDWGTIGRSSLFHSHTSVGVILGGVELFTGFDYQRFGDVDLHGLTAGVRFWY